MNQLSDDKRILGCRYALCVGIGVYTNLANYYDLRYAVDDASAIADQLEQNGDFLVTRLTTPVQTTKAAMDQAVKHLLRAPERQSADLALLYFSGHGSMEPEKDPKTGYEKDTFCLWPSDATWQERGVLNPATLIGISDLTRWFLQAKVHNIVLFLDVCHSGGASVTLQRFEQHLETGPNYFILGAARQDQATEERSELEHGTFTTCLLRAFGQPPTKDGWLTISQIKNFVSEEIQDFTKEQPISIQGAEVFTDSPLLLLRNPGFPELYPLPPVWNVPLRRNPFFTGQENVLSQLASLLQSEQKTALTQPQAINGLGGIGKTQLAIEYAYRHRQDYHAILWGLADTREALISTFVNIAALLDLPEKDEEDQMVIVEAVKTWLKDRSTWLLILDNADELVLVKEFLPPAFRGHLLLTTRAQAMGGLARKLEMEVMRPEVGALLLLRRSGRLALEAPLGQASSLEIQEAKALSQELGGLPLALDQAGAYMEETQCRLGEYRELYHVQRKDLLKTRGLMADDHPESVATTWSLSFQRVEEKNAAAADLLRLCAFLPPDAIPETIFIKGAEHLGPVLAPVFADAFLLKQAIATLRAYSLIDRDPQAQALTIHRLIQEVVRDTIPAEDQQEWRHRIASAATKSFPGLFALEIWEQQLGASHPDTAPSLNNLAVLYYMQGEYEEVEPLLKRALARNEQQLGASHPSIVTNLNNLAALYNDQGKYEEAELLYQRALVICEQQLGASHRNMRTSNIEAFQISGRETDLFVLGESAHRRGYIIRRFPNIVASLNNLATLYCDQGKYEEAEPLYQRALAICEQQLGASHPDTAPSLNNLAIFYYMQGKYAEAELLYQRALVICEQQLGAEHPDTQGIKKNYALLLQAMRHDGKRGIWKRVLERFFQ